MRTELKSNARRRIKRVAGQIAGIDRMVDADRGCDDILQQVSAARSALDQLGVLLLTEHLQTCVLHRDIESSEDCCRQITDSEQSAQIREAITRFLK